MISGGFKNMNADQIIQCILEVMLKLEKFVKGIVEDKIVDGVIDKAPSQNAVYDALAAITANFSKFKIKLEDSFDYTAAQALVGENQIISIPADGKASIVLVNNGLQSLDGIDYSNIIGNTSAEIPHPGKPYFIFNHTDNPITLNDNVGIPSNVYKPFIFYNGENLILPPGGMAEFKFNDVSNTFDKVPGGDGATIVNDLITGGTTAALSAEMGKFLKFLIDSIYQPNVLISSVPPTRSADTFTYPGGGYVALIDKTIRTNPAQFITTIAAASTENHKRVDLIYFKPDNTLAKIIGTEDLIVAPRPDVPNGSVGVSFINVFGNIIQDPTPIIPEISIQDSFGNEKFTVAPDGYIRFRGANFNSATKEVQIDPLVGGVIFVSSSGDDTTGEVENRNKPYLTLNKAIDVFFANPNILYIEIISTGTFVTNKVFNNGTTRTFELRSNFSNIITINTNGVYCFTTQQFKINAPNSTINLSPTTTTSFGSNTHRCFVDINCNVLSNNSFFGADNLGNFTLKCNNLNLTGIGGLHAAKTDSNTTGSIEVGTITFIGNANLFSQNNTSTGPYNLNFKQINHNGAFNLTLPSTAVYSIDHGSITPTGTIAWSAYLSGAAQISIRYKTGAIITSNIGISRFNALYPLELTGICAYSNSDQLLFRDNSSKTTIINAQITCKNLSHNSGDNGIGIRIISSTINVTSTLGTFNTYQGFVHTSPIYYFEGTCYVLGLSPLTTGFSLYTQNVINTASKPIINITKGQLNSNGKFDRGRITIVEAPLNQYFDTVQRQLVIVNEKEEIINQVLDSTKTYVIDGAITLLAGEYIDVPASGLTIEGYGYDTSGIIKNISGQSIFRSPAGNSGNLTLSSVYFNPGLGTVWNLTDGTGGHAIELNDVNFNGGTLGVLNGYRQFTGTTCGFYGLSDGLTLEGNWSGFKLTNSNIIAFGGSGTLFKKGLTTLFSNRFYIDLNLQVATGSKICDFSDSSFSNDKSLQVVNCYCKVNGGINPALTSILFPNITELSSKSYFVNNIGIKNSNNMPYGISTENMPTYANDAAAATGGIVAVGDTYIETSTGYFKKRLT